MIKYRPIIMVGIWYYNQSGVTEVLIRKDPHYDRMCFRSVKTSELYMLSCKKGLGFRLLPFPQLRT